MDELRLRCRPVKSGELIRVLKNKGVRFNQFPPSGASYESKEGDIIVYLGTRRVPGSLFLRHSFLWRGKVVAAWTGREEYWSEVLEIVRE